MQRAKIILAALLAIPLAGCILSGKPAAKVVATPKPAATPAPTEPPVPPPLSIPQTHAQLPPPQPVPQEAIVIAAPIEETPLPPPAPASPPKSPPKNTRPAAGGAVRTESPAPAAETRRLQVQEAISTEEQNRLREEANVARRDVQQRLSQISSRTARQQNDRITRIKTFVTQSEAAEKRGDLKMASELATRALVLAKELR